MPNGSYDVTLYFAEPAEVAGGGRVFDALIEGETVVEDIDVMLWRDGKVRSALTVVVPGIDVADGEMNKVIAADLHVTQSTVEAHRAKIMEKMEAATLSELMRMMLSLEQY